MILVAKNKKLLKKCQTYLNNDHEKQVENHSLTEQSANSVSRADASIIEENFISNKKQSPLYLSSKTSNLFHLTQFELNNKDTKLSATMFSSFEGNLNKGKAYSEATKGSLSQSQLQSEEASATSTPFIKDKGKKYYTSYSKLSEVKLLTIGIASPLRILQWAEKTLPNGKIYGEVLNANTLHHKTFKPQKGGLFCERIFGPLKDFECACGKTDKSIKKLQNNSQNLGTKLDLNLKEKEINSASLVDPNSNPAVSISNQTTNTNLKVVRKFCPDCDVEYTWSVIRRYQIGYIKLSSPITHIWFLKGTPSYLSLLLDIKKRYLQFVTYCSETLTIEKSYLPFYSNQDSSLLFPSLSKVGQQVNQSQLEPASSLSVKKEKRFVCVPKKSWRLYLDKKTRKEELTVSMPLDKTKQKNKLFETNLDYFKNKNLLTPYSSDSDSDSIISLRSEKNKEIRKLKNEIIPFVLQPKNESKITNKNKMFFVSILLLKIYSKYLENVSMRYFYLIQQKKQPSIGKAIDFSNVNEPNSNLVSEKSSLDFSSKKPSFSGDSPSYLGFDNINEKFKPVKVLNLKRTFQKLPLDLYILSSLEIMLQKSSLYLSIETAWEILYKRSFLKTLKKTRAILPKYSNLFSSTSLISRENSVKSNSKLEIFVNNLIQELNLNLKKANINRLNKIQINTLILNNLKIKYTKHILKSLKKLKALNLSIYNTSTFSKKNRFLTIQKNLSYEMIKLFLKNTHFYEKILSELFIHSILIDKFLILYENKYKIQSKLYNSSILPEEKSKILSILNYKNLTENQKLKTKSISTLKTYKKMLMNINQYESFSVSNNNNFKGTMGNFNSKMLLDFSNLNGSKQKNNNFDSKLVRKTSKSPFPSSPSSSPTYKNKIYNNVYTLSHRERWDIDKDWYIFSLFTFGVTDVFDYPISSYKNRLFSLTYSQEYSYSSNFSENWNLPFPMQNLSLKSQKNTITENIHLNNTKLSASFIYSSSFYSGAGIVQQLLNEFDLNEIQKLDKQNRLLLYQINKSILKLKKIVQIFVYDKTSQLKLKELCKKRDLLIRRTKLVRKIYRKNTSPSSMVLTIIPVLPPDLRPIIKMGSQIAASDLNRLYQRVIYRNDRLKKFLKDPATSQSYEMKYAQRLLQEAVDNLIQNGKSGPNTEKDARGRALKSLSDILKGKQGRFRQFLLGKRVDYSGRSVIVVGPKLKLHECGLPLEMAKELYLPFLLKSILNKNYAKTVIGAKTLIQNNPALANELLHEIMKITPILLNRAPTLHRLGIQAFVPRLIEGRAILLHPLVCSAFNADFDGDQMAVHVPITIEARAEAWKLMLSRNNLLAPATGEPLAIPSQDMVLGCYYLTTFSNKSKILRGSGMYFNTLYDVIKLYEEQFIDIHSFVWVKWMNNIENGTDLENPLEIRISTNGQWKEITSNYQRTYNSNNGLENVYMCTTPGRILFNSLIQQLIA